MITLSVSQSLDQMLDIVEAHILDERRKSISAMLADHVDPDEIDVFVAWHDDYMHTFRERTRAALADMLAHGGTETV